MKERLNKLLTVKSIVTLLYDNQCTVGRRCGSKCTVGSNKCNN